MDQIDVLVPIVFFLTVGGLVALRMLKPFGDRVLDLLERTYRVREEATVDGEELARLRKRMDLLAERQDFLEGLISGSKEERLSAGGRDRAVG